MKDILYLVWHYLKQATRSLRNTDYPSVVFLIGLSVLFFLTEILFGADYKSWCFQSARVYEAWTSPSTNPGLIVEQHLKLFPPLFLHGSPEHILGNMIMLWTFGCLVARFLGKWWTIGVYLICGAIGNLFHVYLEPTIGAIGASGSVCAMEGVYFVLALRWVLPKPHVFPLAHPVPPLNLAIFAAIGIAFDIYGVASRTDSNIAYGGHIGGFASGALVALVISSLFRTRESWERSGWNV